MERQLASPWFVAWTALCCAATVAFVTWAAGAGSSEGRLGAGLVGLALGLVMAFAVPVAMLPERERRAVPAEAPNPAWPVAARAPEPQPVTKAAAPTPAPVDEPPTVIRPDLAAQLAAGHALRLDLDHEPAGGRVDDWIAATRTLLERRPGVARYFAALDAKPWPDEIARLDAHVRRLETIVRDFA